MKKYWTQTYIGMALLTLLVVPYSNASAHFEITAPVEILEIIIVGQCSVIMTNDEPYDGMATECELTKDNVRKAHHEISAAIPWPRPVLPLYHATWPTLAMTPSDEAVYCQKFARPVDDAIFFYHHSDIQLSIIHDGASNCESSEGRIKAYPQIKCMGAPTIIFGTGQLIPGVHISFSFANDPHCWVNGYISLEE